MIGLECMRVEVALMEARTVTGASMRALTGRL
jgi:hypothetical protein